MHSINRYAEMREQTSRVGERPLIALPKIPNELELQAGSLVNLAENSERSLENRSKSSSLVFGIARPAPIFRTLSSVSETAPPRAEPLKSICSIATGNCMAMQPTQHSMTPLCTFFSNEVVSNFLPAPALIGTCPRSNSISPRSEMSQPG